MRKIILIPLACGGLALAVMKNEAVSQEARCGFGDIECLEAAVSRACATDAPPGTCEAYVHEALARVDDPSSQLYAAVGYDRLAAIATNEAESEGFRKKSKGVYESIIEHWPVGFAASVAHLSLAADTLEERIARNRLAVQADPSYWHALELLANALRRRGTDPDYLEAAQLTRAAYELKPTHWYLAVNALDLYRLTLQFEEAALFEAQIRRESGFDEFKERLSTPWIKTDLIEFGRMMDTVCHAYLVEALDESACVAGLNAAVDELEDSVDPVRRAAVAELIGTNIAALVRATDVDGLGGPYHDGVLAIAEAMVESGDATASVYAHISHVAPALEDRVAASEQMVALAPDNAEYRYRLALQYLNLNRFSEAAHQLRLLDNTPTRLSRDRIEEKLRQAESGAEAARQGD